ncbi:MAG TPA: hypothetical protein VK870_03945, partial [Ignavibacteriaceae bacterium]|nr:hypothetical protein [Ignavibacteriaceae bacterium]
MQYKSVHIIPLTIILFTLNSAALNKSKTDLNPDTYFPVNQNLTLVYESSFGESLTKYFQDGDCIISLSEADDFVYKQNLILKDDGVYTT